MFFRQWIVFLMAVIMIMAVWCVFVIKMNKRHECHVFTAIQPMDLTVTYCESCKKCTIPEPDDLLEFETYEDGPESLEATML